MWLEKIVVMRIISIISFSSNSAIASISALAAVSALTLLADSIILALVYKRCFISYDRYFVPPASDSVSTLDRIRRQASSRANSAQTSAK